MTLDVVKRHLAEGDPGVKEIRTAVLWYKAVSRSKPDYFVDYLAESPWIHQPFEPYDLMTADDLLAAQPRSARSRIPRGWPRPSRKALVPPEGLEPPHPYRHMDLNHARLPIPPRRQEARILDESRPHFN